jgi:hypothetical protein
MSPQPWCPADFDPPADRNEYQCKNSIKYHLVAMQLVKIIDTGTTRFMTPNCMGAKLGLSL